MTNSSRREGIQSLSGNGDALFSTFYNKLKDIKEYYRKFPNIPIPNPDTITSGITGSANVSFSAEECNGKYLDLHLFHDLYNNLPWIKDKPVDYFVFLRRVYCFRSSISGKGKQYIDYLKQLYEYTTDHIRRSQPLFDLNETIKSFLDEFELLWKSGKRNGETKPLSLENNQEDDSNDKNTKELQDNQNENLGDDHSFVPKTYCLDCLRRFAKPSVFNGHLKGKKHKKAVQRNKSFEKEIFLLEYKLQRLGEQLSDQIVSTKIHVETKLARRYEDIEADLEDEIEAMSDSDTDEEEEMTRRCITNYPVGWDGKPIPYWLYKLHGLGIEYKCEICGNSSYWGRRAFERHFQEWRHAYGMKCLGIPNTKHFNEITNINDALACKLFFVFFCF